MNLKARVEKLERGTGAGKPQTILLWLGPAPGEEVEGDQFLSKEVREQRLAEAEAEVAGTNNILLIYTGNIDPTMDMI